MSVMTSPNGVKTATCRIVYDFDSLWAQVTNVTSGNTVTIDVEGLDRESLFSPQENALYDTLCGGLNNRHQDLTGAEMRLILSMSGKAQAARQLGKPVEIVSVQPLIAPKPAPVINTTSRSLEKKGAAEVTRFVANAEYDTTKGTDHAERLASALERVSHNREWDFCVLDYDIAEDTKDLDSPELNPGNLHWWLPSDYLWRQGFRSQNSKWVMLRDKMFSDPVIAEVVRIWGEMGKVPSVTGKGKPRVKWGIRRFHPDEAEDIRREASEALDNLLRSIHTSLIQGIDKADRALEQASDVGPLTEREESRAKDVRNNVVRAKIKEAIADLEKALKCAESFDETANKVDLFEGLRSAIRSQAAAFNAMAERRKVKPAPTV